MTGFDLADVFVLPVESLWLGWPARLLAYTCLGLALWRGLYRQQFLLGALFLLMSLLFTYVGAVLALVTE